jgi:hypothetical protein
MKLFIQKRLKVFFLSFCIKILNISTSMGYFMKFDKTFEKYIKLYEAGLPTTIGNPMTPSTNLNQKKPQGGTSAPPDVGTQPQTQSQTQAPTQAQNPNQAKPFNPQEFETMVQTIVQHSTNPEAQAILKKYMGSQQSTTV